MSTPQEWVLHALENRAEDFRKLHGKFRTSPEETVRHVSITLTQKVATTLKALGCPSESEIDDAKTASIAEQVLAEHNEADGQISTDEIHKLVLPFALIHARLQRALATIESDQPTYDTSGDSGILQVIPLDEDPPEEDEEEGADFPGIEP